MAANWIERSPVSPRSRIPMILLGALLALAGSRVPPGIASQSLPPTQAAGPAQTTALVVSATPAMHVLGNDGLEHVQYDLIITNAFVAPVTLTAIEVLAPDGRLLVRLVDDALKAVTQSFSGMDPTDQVPVAGVAATIIELALPPSELPDRVSHRIAYEIAPGAPALIDSRQIVGPMLDLGPRVPVVLSPPLRGTGWFNGN